MEIVFVHQSHNVFNIRISSEEINRTHNIRFSALINLFFDVSRESRIQSENFMLRLFSKKMDSSKDKSNGVLRYQCLLTRRTWTMSWKLRWETIESTKLVRKSTVWDTAMMGEWKQHKSYNPNLSPIYSYFLNNYI